MVRIRALLDKEDAEAARLKAARKKDKNARKRWTARFSELQKAIVVEAWANDNLSGLVGLDAKEVIRLEPLQAICRAFEFPEEYIRPWCVCRTFVYVLDDDEDVITHVLQRSKSCAF